MGIRTGKTPAVLFCFFLMGIASLSFAKTEASSKQDPSGALDKANNRTVRINVDVFIDGDRDSIRRYFDDRSGSLPPGLAKRGGNLPPGLQKQLRKNGQLPPGLQKKIIPFPVDLEDRLPRLKPGLVRGIIEGRAVIFNAETSVILDIFSIF